MIYITIELFTPMSRCEQEISLLIFEKLSEAGFEKIFAATGQRKLMEKFGGRLLWDTLSEKSVMKNPD